MPSGKHIPEETNKKAAHRCQCAAFSATSLSAVCLLPDGVDYFDALGHGA